MATYAVTEKTTGAVCFTYEAVARIEWEGFEFSTHDHIEQPDSPVEAPAIGPRRLTKQQFYDRLGPTAVAFILLGAKTSVDMEMWVKRLELLTPDPDGTSVDLDDPRTIAGVQAIGAAMSAAGVLPESWSVEVLA